MTQNLFKNNNLISSHKFKILIDCLPNIEYFTKRVPIAGIQLPTTHEPTPFTTLPIWGDHLEYEEFDITFLVDEDLNNYKEISDWLVKLARPQSYSQRTDSTFKTSKTNDKVLTSDISLITMKNSNTPNKIITYHNCFPNYLSRIEFNIDNDQSAPIYANAKFSYSFYTWEKNI